MQNLTPTQRELLASARRAVLGTRSASGRPRLVPIAFAVVEGDGALVIYSAIDEKPKSVEDAHDLARVRDVLARPDVSVLIDEWHENWSQLAWLRLDGTATLLEPTPPNAAEHAQAVRLLRQRYPQYDTQRLERRPVLRIRVERAVGWSAAQ